MVRSGRRNRHPEPPLPRRIVQGHDGNAASLRDARPEGFDMNVMVVSGIVLGCTFGGALLGMFLHRVLPDDHLSDQSRGVLNLAIGIIGTMAALVVGLLIASAKGSFDKLDDDVKKGAVQVLELDRVLAHYGPETKDVRDLIRRALASRLDATWPEDGSHASTVDVPEGARGIESIEERTRALAPQNDAQRDLRSRALDRISSLEQTLWLVFAETGSSIPVPFLVVVILWFTVILGVIGLFAPRNATVVGVLFVCSLSIAASLFLILEMDQPLGGVLKISSAPLRYALAHLGQ